jgi:hypothetical protein
VAHAGCPAREETGDEDFLLNKLMEIYGVGMGNSKYSLAVAAKCGIPRF